MPHSILLVEDDPDLSQVLAFMLRRAGFIVSVAVHGGRLFDPTGLLPELVLMDQRLPGANGLEICRKIKSDPRLNGIIVIMLSAAPIPDAQLKASGADGFVVKPFEAGDLIAIINRHLEG